MGESRPEPGKAIKELGCLLIHGDSYGLDRLIEVADKGRTALRQNEDAEFWVIANVEKGIFKFIVGHWASDKPGTLEEVLHGEARDAHFQIDDEIDFQVNRWLV